MDDPRLIEIKARTEKLSKKLEWISTCDEILNGFASKYPGEITIGYYTITDVKVHEALKAFLKDYLPKRKKELELEILRDNS